MNYLLDKYNLKYQALRYNIDLVFLNKFDKIIKKIEQQNT